MGHDPILWWLGLMNYKQRQSISLLYKTIMYLYLWLCFTRYNNKRKITFIYLLRSIFRKYIMVVQYICHMLYILDLCWRYVTRAFDRTCRNHQIRRTLTKSRGCARGKAIRRSQTMKIEGFAPKLTTPGRSVLGEAERRRTKRPPPSPPLGQVTAKGEGHKAKQEAFAWVEGAFDHRPGRPCGP